MLPETKSLGKYQHLEEIGRGGFGTVFRARDPDLGREVAIKVLDPLLMREPAWVARFRREAQVIARLDHPHIVTVHEIGQTESALYIVERLVKGGSLADRIAAQGALPWPDVVRMVGEMAAALDYAHAQGVVHRDLKSANVLLDPERGAQLTDFGFARMVAESSFSVSVSGGIVGTPQYIAPEVWEGQPASAQTDIYALGCIAYEMVMGRALFQGDTTPSVMRAHFMPLKLPERWPEGVPAGLSEVLESALAKEPGARYARAGDLASALAALEEDRLAGPYADLQAAVTAQNWAGALALAARIRAESPAYRDVAALEQAALRGQEQAARARQAAMWREAAEAALAEGDLPGAERAARQWAALSPEDREARAFAERVRVAAQVRGPQEAREDPGPRKARKGAEDAEGGTGHTGRVDAPGAEDSGPRRTRKDAEGAEGIGAKAEPVVAEAGRPSARRRKVPGWVWAGGALLLVAAIVVVVTVLAFRQAAERERSARAAQERATATARAAAAKGTATAQAQKTAWAEHLEEAAARSIEEKLAAASARADWLAGPASGSLVHDTGNSIVEDYNPAVSAVNLVAEAVFTNPYSAADGSWDYGFMFRTTYSPTNSHVILLLSAGRWEHRLILGGSHVSNAVGPVAGLNTGAGETNRLRVVALGDEGALWVNDTFAGALDLSGRVHDGNVSVVTGWWAGDEIDGHSTGFTDFSVWSLD